MNSQTNFDDPSALKKVCHAFDEVLSSSGGNFGDTYCDTDPASGDMAWPVVLVGSNETGDDEMT